MIQHKINKLKAEIDLAENQLITNLEKSKSQLSQNQIVKAFMPSLLGSNAASSPLSSNLIELFTQNSGSILSAIKTILRIKRLIT